MTLLSHQGMEKAGRDPSVLQELQDLEQVLGPPFGFVVVFHLGKRDSGAVFAILGCPVILDITSGSQHEDEHRRRNA